MIFGTKLVTIRFIIEFSVSVAVMDKILLYFELDSKAKSPLFLRYKLSHAEKINRHPEGGGHRSMSTPLNTPLGATVAIGDDGRRMVAQEWNLDRIA